MGDFRSPPTPKWTGEYKRLGKKSMAGRSIAIAILVAVVVAIVIVARTVL